MKKLLAFLMLALPLTVAASPSIVKSPVDSKSYRAVTLRNGLKALLVSDPDTDKAAASLDVHVGSGSDPQEWQGLAHLLEHMLFLGSEKYPDAGEYRSFISDHGGNNNAYTSFDHTNYYFDISAEHLRPALERFSRFFIDPTLDATFIDRERSVVHSEYQSRRKDDRRRLWAARQQLLNPAHPASRFSVGSEHTLRDREGQSARQQLLNFHARHYSANLMTLAVVGQQPLDQLERWAAELFAEVSNRDRSAALFTQPYINPRLVSSRLNVVPQKDEISVVFMFPIASMEAHYRSKPLGYLANLIGHEGEGSLLALLKSRGWARALSAGAGFMDKAQGTFEVAVQLTEAGLGRIQDIGGLLFQAIRLIESSGVEAWRFAEEKRLAEIAFRFAEEHGAGATAQRLAASLHRYPRAEVLRGPYLMADYRPALMRALLAQLKPSNVLLQVVSRQAQISEQHADGPSMEVPDSGETPFYDVDYSIQPISHVALAQWRRARQGESAHEPSLALPAPNPYIPERLVALALAPGSIPQPLDSHAGIAAWRLSDPQFGTPRAVFYVGIDSPLADHSPRHLALTELFVRLVGKRLDERGYPARLAGLDYAVYRRIGGFSIRINGYEDKQPALLEAMLAALRAPSFDAAELALVKAALKREWNNTALESPSQQTAHEIYRLLLHPYWTEAERLAALDSIEIADVEAHAKGLLEKIKVTSLSHGDVAPARSAKMNAMLQAAFAESEWLDAVKPTVVRILAPEHAYLRNMSVAHDDSALAIYFQGLGKSDPERARIALLGRLLESPFFFNIRTTNKVGYLVYATPMNILGAPGLLFSVQSSTHSPADIERLINAFLDEFEQILDGMDADAFAQVKRGLIHRILARDKNLAERAERHWREISLKKFTFDSRQRLAQAIDGLDKTAMRAYFHRLIKQRPRKLMIQSLGAHAATTAGLIEGEQYQLVRDAVEFRQSAQSFFRFD